jgi:hypothetical protein
MSHVVIFVKFWYVNVKMFIDSNITTMETVTLMDVLFEAYLWLRGTTQHSLCMEWAVQVSKSKTQLSQLSTPRPFYAPRKENRYPL